MRFTIGADPELFISGSDGVVPITGLLGGTKGDPVPATVDGLAYGLQEDNLMAEYNVPATELGDQMFSRVVQTGRELVLNAVQQAGGPELTFCVDPEVRFEPHIVMTPQAQMVGCSPDQDAYTGGVERGPMNAGDLGLWRYAGGHIHVGHDLDIPNHVLVQMLDATIGLAGVMHDASQKRRYFYGKAGIYRDKEYGFEYRTPSNWWIWSPAMCANIEATIYEIMWLAVEDVGSMQAIYGKMPLGDIQQAIHYRNLPLAQDLAVFLGKQNSVFRNSATRFGLYV